MDNEDQRQDINYITSLVFDVEVRVLSQETVHQHSVPHSLVVGEVGGVGLVDPVLDIEVY